NIGVNNAPVPPPIDSFVQQQINNLNIQLQAVQNNVQVLQQ
ncbi:unnamed protein product, partial [Rotaria socialis]